MPSSPDDFREEIQQHADEAAEQMQEPALPEELSSMESMAETAEADVAPEPAQEPELADDESLSPVQFQQNVVPAAEPPELAALEGMQQMAAADVPVVSPEPPPELDALADMERAAKRDLPPERSQFAQVQQSIPRQQQEQLEFEAGRFDAGMADMDQLTAETAYRETDYAWKRLMTHMVIDHQHRLEQLLAMLERER